MKRTYSSVWTRIAFVMLTIPLVLGASRRIAAQGNSNSNNRDANRANGCSNELVHGTYGVSFNGTISALGVVAGIGRIALDRTGDLSGSYAESLNGTIIRGNFTGSFALHSDCTGSATVASLIPGSWSVGLNFTVVDNGTEILLLDTDPGVVVSGSAKKQ